MAASSPLEGYIKKCIVYKIYSELFHFNLFQSRESKLSIMNYRSNYGFDLMTEVMGGVKPKNDEHPVQVTRIADFPFRLPGKDKQEFHAQVTLLNNLPFVNICKFFNCPEVGKFIPVKKGGTCIPAHQWWQFLTIVPLVTETLLKMGLTPPHFGNHIIITRCLNT